MFCPEPLRVADYQLPVFIPEEGVGVGVGVGVSVSVSVSKGGSVTFHLLAFNFYLLIQ
jgi:hypothetical protein